MARWLLRCLAAVMLAAPAQAALQAEYRFNETSYSGAAGEVLDSSGNFHHGRTVGGAGNQSGGICRSLSVASNSTSSAVAMDTGINPAVTLGATGSISFWYYSTSTDASDRVLLDATTSNGAQFMVWRNDDSASPSTIDVDLGFTVNSASGAEHAVFKNDAMSDGAWWHITVTWKLVTGGGASRIRTYVNGNLQSEASFSIAIAGLASGLGTLYVGDNRSSATSIPRSAAGLFDQVKLYNHELTTTEINADSAASPPCQDLHHYELTGASPSAGVGSAVTYTVKACANASCSSTYTQGTSGSVSLAGVGATWSSGPAFTMASGASTATVTLTYTGAGTATLGLTGASPVAVTSPPLYCGMGSSAASGNACTVTVTGGLHHLQIGHASGSGLTCAATSVTVTACADAACSTVYTGGTSGSLTATGSGMTVNWPSGAAFSIPSGSSSTTVSLQQVTAGSVVLGSAGLSPAASSSTACTFGTPGCTFTAADAGLLFDVPHHVAGLSKSVTVSAVRKSDNSLACTPAFQSVSRPVRFSCSYANPGTGTKAVRVGGMALNAGNNANAVCDATGATLNLAFNASGVATTTVEYADVGQMNLVASFTGSSGGENGLVMSGSDSFVTQPWYLVVTVPGGNKVAGTAFSATLSAVNVNSAVTPNFGRETPPETATLNFVRAKPLGSGAVTGSFSASPGNFSNGSATISNISYSEVGRIDITTMLTSGSYLGTGWKTGGGSNFTVFTCASENGTCTLPSGVQAIVAYGTTTAWNALANQSGSIPCNNATFGDPAVGTAKSCFYLATSGVNSASSGSVGPFVPHHFDVTTTQACGSFSYGGQPFGVSVTARNAAGGITLNYDGSAATSPNHAKAVTLSDANALGNGSFAANTIALTAFSAGTASGSPSYSFTSKTTAPSTIKLRATDTDGVSSASGSEASTPLRSGRLRLSTAFGKVGAPLGLALSADYWSGNAWVINSADGCTGIPAASVVLSNARDARGAASSATTSAGAVSLVAGQGMLWLAAPTPAGQSATFDVALNLGSGGADLSCQASHPASTGAAVPWLRSRNGSCAATWDRDPSARASFGIYSPETRKLVHQRELH